MNEIVIYVDGGCKGNGSKDAKAYGSYAVTHKGEVKKEHHTPFPGASTNNEAEYGALLLAMTYITGLKQRATCPLPDIVIKTDSQLVYGQLTQGWKVKAENLRNSVQAAKAWMEQNPGVEIQKVGRDEIVKVLGH